MDYSNRGNKSRNMIESTEVLNEREGKNPMESVIWFVGIVLLYFALQLWILPKLGIPT